ncbi:MAG TPA: FAD-dependent oxidoreductase [Acidimicrobiales bacterium]|nr:FAD-dependent oxidoreductase [Acidimicrobiales bacterium]
MASRALTSSLWAQSLKRHYPPLTEDRTVDVVVVGAGIAGMLTAALLRETGREVLVVERDLVGGVATRNTTAKVTALQGHVLSTIEEIRGQDAALAYASAQSDAVEGLRALIERLDVDCAVTASDAITYAASDEGVSRVADELRAAQLAGLAVESTTDVGAPFDVLAAIVLRDQFHINPAQLCQQLAAGLGDDGVVEATTVTDITEGTEQAIVTTELGARVFASHAVLATQAPIVDPMLLADRCSPMQSYVVSLRANGPVSQTMCLSADDFTISLRPAEFEGEQILIVGGNGHRMGESASSDRWSALEAWAAKHVGQTEVLHRWATHDLVTSDHVPFIGRLKSGAERRWLATGFGKWGMTNGYVAARLITDGVCQNEPQPWASTFDSTRVRASLTHEMKSNIGAAVHHLVGDRIARRPEPRCTHQGCVLRRDDALDTWDCPCHGSRFEADGTVIQGPANAPLK